MAVVQSTIHLDLVSTRLFAIPRVAYPHVFQYSFLCVLLCQLCLHSVQSAEHSWICPFRSCSYSRCCSTVRGSDCRPDVCNADRSFLQGFISSSLHCSGHSSLVSTLSECTAKRNAPPEPDSSTLIRHEVDRIPSTRHRGTAEAEESGK